MKLPIYQIDAFTSRLFGGNPAAVVTLDRCLPDEVLQSIAAENNLAETAFVIPGPEMAPTAMVHSGRRNRSVRSCHTGDRTRPVCLSLSRSETGQLQHAQRCPGREPRGRSPEPGFPRASRCADRSFRGAHIRSGFEAAGGLPGAKIFSRCSAPKMRSGNCDRISIVSRSWMRLP